MSCNLCCNGLSNWFRNVRTFFAPRLRDKLREKLPSVTGLKPMANCDIFHYRILYPIRLKPLASHRLKISGTVFFHTDPPGPVNSFFFCLFPIFHWGVKECECSAKLRGRWKQNPLKRVNTAPINALFKRRFRFQSQVCMQTRKNIY